jgi:hypothetical protein
LVHFHPSSTMNAVRQTPAVALSVSSTAQSSRRGIAGRMRAGLTRGRGAAASILVGLTAAMAFAQPAFAQPTPGTTPPVASSSTPSPGATATATPPSSTATLPEGFAAADNWLETEEQRLHDLKRVHGALAGSVQFTPAPDYRQLDSRLADVRKALHPDRNHPERVGDARDVSFANSKLPLVNDAMNANFPALAEAIHNKLDAVAARHPSLAARVAAAQKNLAAIAEGFRSSKATAGTQKKDPDFRYRAKLGGFVAEVQSIFAKVRQFEQSSSIGAASPSVEANETPQARPIGQSSPTDGSTPTAHALPTETGTPSAEEDSWIGLAEETASTNVNTFGAEEGAEGTKLQAAADDRPLGPTVLAGTIGVGALVLTGLGLAYRRRSALAGANASIETGFTTPAEDRGAVTMSVNGLGSGLTTTDPGSPRIPYIPTEAGFGTTSASDQTLPFPPVDDSGHDQGHPGPAHW